MYGGARLTDWPPHYPSACPPEDAEATDSEFFRLVDSDPVEETDFVSLTELVLAGVRKRRRGWDTCMAAGVSVFDSEETARRTQGAFGALKAKRLASGALKSSGVVKRTGTSEGHHTWWRPNGDVVWRDFEVRE